MKDRVVICMRWGALYPAAYVNVLHAAVRRNVTGNFKFVCLTNETDGLDDGIEAYPIPDLGYSEQHWRRGAWPKLSVFVADLYGLRGRALFIDLDSVILESLDPFFEVPGDLVSIAGGPNWRRGGKNPSPGLASGVFSFDIGSQPQIVERFQADPEGAFNTFGLEQRFTQAHVTSWTTWPESWVISFKKHLRRPMLIDLVLPPRLPDPGTKIVAFHGDPRPIEVARAGSNYWGGFPRAGRGPIKWVRDYWLQNGFKDDI